MCKPGDHVVIPDDAYGGTYRLFAKVAQRWGLEYTPAQVSDVEAVRAAIQPGRTRIVWVETPTNPLLDIADIAAIAAVAHEAGALLVVDNTFASPYLQQPLALGADVVVHSTTKYSAGTPTWSAARSSSRTSRLAREGRASTRTRWARSPGRSTPGSCCAGIKTLGVRMDRHCDNAERVVAFLTDHPSVSQVIYPGLPEHPGHEVARQADARFGGMVSFRAAGGEQKALDICNRATAVHARRVARRRRVADRAPGPDDARLGGRARRSRCPATWSGCLSASRRSTT